MKLNVNLRISAFSLIELSVVLVIVGVLMGAIFKGQDLLDVAKVRSVVHDFQHIKVACHNYQDTYGYLPGDDPQAESRFGTGISSGNGNGLIESAESKNLWIHLNKSGDWESTTAPASKFGGLYEIVTVSDTAMPGNWILLSKNGEGLLTPKQVQNLMSRIDEGETASDAGRGLLRAKEGQGVGAGECVINGKLNIENKKEVCVVFMKL